MKEPEATIFVREAALSVMFRWVCDDTEHWQAIKADLKRSFPHWSGLTFDGDERMWCLPLHMRHQFCRWADAWFGLNRQRWETVRDDAGYRRAGSAHSGKACSIEGAYTSLHLLPTAPLWACEAVWRAHQKHAHPDIGGDHAAAVTINQAISTIRDAYTSHQARPDMAQRAPVTMTGDTPYEQSRHSNSS